MSDNIAEPRYNCVILTNGSEVVSEVNGRQINRLEPSLWYLVDDHSDLYRIYEGKELAMTLLDRGKTLAWIDRIREILMDESDARWLIQRLQDRGIVNQEGGL